MELQVPPPPDICCPKQGMVGGVGGGFGGGGDLDRAAGTATPIFALDHIYSASADVGRTEGICFLQGGGYGT